MIKEYDYLLKLVIIGNSNVGKSSLMLRFADDQFNDTYLTTIGVDFRFKTMPIDTKNVKLQIWDTAGQERFRTITNAYYKGADGIVIVYDTTSLESFEDIEKYWINEVESYAEQGVELLLLGNKNDSADLKQVETEQAKEYADKKKMIFYECSAKTADGVNDGFIGLAKKLMAKKDVSGQKKQNDKKNNGTSMTLNRNSNYNKEKQNENCC